jgi:hypothetical protein
MAVGGCAAAFFPLRLGIDPLKGDYRMFSAYRVIVPSYALTVPVTLHCNKEENNNALV